MARESLGFVKLEWVCPNCGVKNPGPNKFCTGCGASQPQDVKFQQAEQSNLITDQAELAQAKAGPDIHCAFCGARNPGNATVCAACGGDLTQGAKRESGQVLGAHSSAPAKPVLCAFCGSENPASAQFCGNCGGNLAAKKAPTPPPAASTGAKIPVWVWIILAVVVLGICGLIASLAFHREQTTGEVSSTHWQRQVNVEVFGPVEKDDWEDEVPADADVLSCDYKFKNSQDEPAPVATQVCGTPYTVDQGSGFGEVVQDCTYEVYEKYCSYTQLGWQAGDPVRVEGDGPVDDWPQVAESDTLRASGQSESFVIVFTSERGNMEYRTSDLSTYEQFTVGSRWNLEVDGFGSITNVTPAE